MRIEDLKKESVRWEQSGIISAEQRGRILALYPEKKSGTAALVFAGLGAALTGAGIILIFAVNWGKLPVPLKLSIAFLPLLGAIAYAGWTLLRRYGSAAFRETAGIFLSLGIYAAIALIAQVFHDSRDLPAFVLACSLLSLPGAYLLNSTGAAAVYTAGVIFAGWKYPVWAALLLCAAIIPLFVLKLLRPRFKTVPAAAQMPLEENKFPANFILLLFSAALINILLIIFIKIKTPENYTDLISIVFVSAQVLLLLDAAFMRYAMRKNKTGEASFLTPPRALAQFLLILIMLICAITSISASLHDDYSVTKTAWIDLLITAALAACYGLIRLLFIKQKTFETADIYMGICLLLQLLLPRILILSNVILLALGIYYCLQGGRKLQLRYLNMGILFLMYIIILRFFDMNVSLAWRGILFIFMGAAFLICNVIMTKKKRNKKSQMGAVPPPADTPPETTPDVTEEQP